MRELAGKWWVAIWGTFEKGNEVRTLQEEKQITLKRGAVEYISFDLQTTAGEYRLAIFDGDAPDPIGEILVDHQARPVARLMKIRPAGCCELIITCEIGQLPGDTQFLAAANDFNLTARPGQRHLLSRISS